MSTNIFAKLKAEQLLLTKISNQQAIYVIDLDETLFLADANSAGRGVNPNLRLIARLLIERVSANPPRIILVSARGLTSSTPKAEVELAVNQLIATLPAKVQPDQLSLHLKPPATIYLDDKAVHIAQAEVSRLTLAMLPSFYRSNICRFAFACWEWQTLLGLVIRKFAIQAKVQCKALREYFVSSEPN